MKWLGRYEDHAYALLRIAAGFMLIACRGGGKWCLDRAD